MNRFSRAVLLLVVALGVLSPVTMAPAQADPIGGLIVVPGSGTDLSGIRVRTSAGCPAQANAYYATVKGRGFPPDGQIVTSNTQAGFSHNFGFDAYFLMIMRDYASDNHTTLGGRYDITVFCVDAFTLHDYGEFTGSMEFTSATHYEALGSAKPIGSPPSPIELAPDGSAIDPRATLPSTVMPSGTGDQHAGVQVAPRAASPPTTALPGSGPSGRTAQEIPVATPTVQPRPDQALGDQVQVGHAGSDRYALTDRGFMWLALVGVVLAGGVVIVVANRIRKQPPR